MDIPSTSRAGPAVPTTLGSHRRSFMPGELLGESGIDSARGRAVDRVYRRALLALDAAGTRERIVTIAFESHEDVDTVAGDAAPRVVGEAEPIVHLTRWERDPDQGGNVEHGPELDASWIDCHRPVWNEPVPRRPNPERGTAYDEVAHCPADALLDVDDAAIPEPSGALGVQLAPEVRCDASDQLPFAGEQLFGALACRPFRLVEDAIEGRNEGAERCRVRRHVGAVPEPRVVRGASRGIGGGYQHHGAGEK